MSDAGLMSELPPPTPPPAGKLWLKRLLRFAILAVTCGFVARHVVHALEEVNLRELSVDPTWMAVAVMTYVIGLALLGIPWALVLRDSGQSVGLLVADRVYIISHLGKYVPGKAMAIIIRCVLLGPRGVPSGPIIVTSFYETFLTMASGSCLALLCWWLVPLPSAYAAVWREHPAVMLGVIGLAAGFTTAVLPPVFLTLTRILTMPIQAVKSWSQHPVRWRTFLAGFALGLVSWSIQGLSYVAVIRAITPEPMGLGGWGAATMGVSLSIVVGFLSMLPGQIGVRELILIEALIPLVGKEWIAVTASLLHRLVTLGGELGASAVLYFGGRR